MFKLFPSEYVKNVSFVDLKALWDSGKRGIVIDIDNTICKDEQFEIEPFAIKFIKTAKKIGFKICLMSNNSLTRVQPIGKALDCLYHYKARKPHRSAYETCLKKIGVPVEKAVMIGD
ncbi:MAG: HAD hydrolase family protein, partial [Bacillota bacterium]|nr:HAD hydrolase family protein [Bacillota bacterium]